MSKPTIYEVLAVKLGRLPTHKEQVDEVKRILEAVLIERATSGKLKHQQSRR